MATTQELREEKKRRRGNTSNSQDVTSTFDIIRSKYALSQKELDKLQKYENELAKEAVETKAALMKKAEEEAHKKRLENYEKEGNKIAAFWEKSFGTVDAAMGTLTSVIDKSLKSYLDVQQSLAAHLSGSSNSLSSIMNRLQGTLSSTSLVKQENVFNNLASLVKSGITYNVEQRAFLQTLASDIDMVFNASNGSLTQLIRLQNSDLSANRAAIEYSLQQFLNQNYQTSEYIRHGFLQVSESLLSSQSTMSASAAMQYEAAIQGQLGQLYSAGFNESTVTGIAGAINALGSGQIPTGGGLSNLVLMAAARAGLDYGSLLNEGLNAKSADTILTSLSGYLSEMGANQSNVVKAQLGNLFGVTLTDIMAAQNLRETSGTISTDISGLLGDYGGFMSFGKRLENVLANVVYGFGTNMASNAGLLMGYEFSKLIANSGLGNLLSSTGEALDVPIVSQALKVAGVALNYAPLIPIIGSAITWIPELVSSLSYTGSPTSLFNALGQNISGSTFKVSSAGVSGSMYVGTGDTSDIINSSTSSLNDFTSNVTTVENEKATIDENVETITNTVSLIHDILDERLASMDASLNELTIAFNLVTNGWGAILGGTPT